MPTLDIKTSPDFAEIPKVSLVMTVYNAAAYLATALESVLEQTFPHWELIVWDDGSTDGSAAIAETYAAKDPRICFWASAHLGRVEALQQAHALTQGEYVGWLDADDCLSPTALEETVRFLDSHADYGMVYTDHIILDTQDCPQGLGHRCRIPYSPQRLLLDLMTFHFRLLRQSVFTAVGGFDLAFGSSGAEDYDLCLKVSEVTQIFHLERPLYGYRLNPQGLSQQRRQMQRQYSIRATNQALQRRGLAPMVQLVENEATGKVHMVRQATYQPQPITEAARSHFRQGQQWMRQGQLTQAIAHFQAALRLQPDYFAAYNQLGNALQKLGRLSEAIGAYQQLLILNPAVAEAYCNLGAIWQIQGHIKAAIAAYQQALALKPELSVAQCNLDNLRSASTPEMSDPSAIAPALKSEPLSLVFPAPT